MKLIIRAPNWVGDAVMAMPVVDNTKEMTGADHVAIMARAGTAPLFANHPDVDRVVIIDDKKSRIRGPRKSANLIKEDHYDVGLLLPPSFSSALIFKLAGVTGRVGFSGDGRSLLLTRGIKIPDEPKHRARQYLYLMEQMIGRKGIFRNPRLYLSHEDIERGEAVLRERPISYDDPYIAISPQAVAESRRWGVDKYGTLAKRLTDEIGCKVVLLGTGADEEAGAAVKNHAPDSIINLCGQTDLMAAAAILSFSRLFVGNDSGLAHLAAAVGCPIVVLSGPDDPAETSPLADKKKVVIKDIDCISCVKNVCPKSGDDFMRCMKLIQVDEVTDAAKSIYKD
jgi:heptosyltransferase-2